MSTALLSGTSKAGLVVMASLLVWFAIQFSYRYLTRRQRARASQAQLQRVIDNLTEGVLVVNDRFEVLLYNHAASVLLSPPGKVRRLDPIQDVYDLFTADGTPLAYDLWPSVRAFRGDYVTDFPILLRHRQSGEMILRLLSTYPFTVDGSKRTWIMCTFRDETAKRRMEEARNRLAFIVESSEDAIIGKDTQGIINSWNKGAERIFGYTAEEMIGQSILRLLPPGREDEEQEILKRILRDEPVHHFNTTRVTRDGRTIHVSLSISPIKDSTGRIVGASKIARDMTGLRNLEEQLQQSQKMDALGQLTGGIAHDFNNLLGIMLGNLELLEPLLGSDAKALELAGAAQRAAERAAELTRRLLAFSSTQPLQPRLTPIHLTVHNTLALAVRALGPGIEIRTQLDESLPSVYIDPTGLESALLNMIVNARDAMPEGGRLGISTRQVSRDDMALVTQKFESPAEHYLCLSVSDNGVGMTPETLERAFDPFFTTKPRGQGTGLGLAIVYGFAKQSNGTVRIYSELGYGTTVSLYLPLSVQPELPEPAPRTLPPAPLNDQVRTLLVVDDEPHLLQMASVYLERLGYRTLRAGDAVTALELVEQYPELDLMLTDVIMPGSMDGFDLAHRARLLRPDIAIVYMSGFPADALAQRRFTSGSDVMLMKPYRLSELGEAVHEACKVRLYPTEGSPD